MAAVCSICGLLVQVANLLAFGAYGSGHLLWLGSPGKPAVRHLLVDRPALLHSLWRRRRPLSAVIWFRLRVDHDDLRRD